MLFYGLQINFKQTSAFVTDDGVLTEDVIDARVNEMVEQHKQKVEWKTQVD